MYIYAEFLILENLVINYIILYVTKKFTKTETSIWQLATGALIGALYTLVVFYPSLIFLSGFLIKVAVSILMIIIAFNPVKFTTFMRVFATFYVVSFVFAGAALAFLYLTKGDILTGKGVFYIKDFSIKLLIIAIITAWILIRFTWGFIQIRLNRGKIFIPITVVLNNKKAELIALLDTGNSLRDPISRTPVIVVEFSAVKYLLPNEIQHIFLRYQENSLEAVSEVMSHSINQIKFRLIPFRSIGRENGMLLGFKPDNVILIDEEREIKVSDIIIGIYNNRLSNDNEYMALLHPDILN